MSTAAEITTPGQREAWPFWVVLSYLALVCLPIRFELGAFQLTGLRLFLALIFLPVLIATFRRRPPGTDLIDAALMLHLVWSAIAITQTSPEQLLENTGANTLELMGGYLIARLCITTPQRFRQTVLAIAILGTATVPFAIWESLSNTAIIIAAIEALPVFNSVEPIDIARRMGLFRAQVVFAHPIHYGLFMGSFFALVWWTFKSRPIYQLGFAMAAVAGTFFALSSGAILFLFIQIILIAWTIAVGARPRVWLVFGIVFAVLWVGIDLLSNRSPLRVFMSYATFSAHNAFWRGLIFEWGMLNIAQNPIFGLGFNDWIRPAFMLSGSLDNFWLTVAMRYGIPGFLLMTLGVGAGLYAVCTATQPADRNLRVGWVIAMIGFIIALGTVHVWTSIYSYVFFLFGAGLFLKEPQRQTKPRTEPASKTLVFTRDHTLVFTKTGATS